MVIAMFSQFAKVNWESAREIKFKSKNSYYQMTMLMVTKFWTYALDIGGTINTVLQRQRTNLCNNKL